MHNRISRIEQDINVLRDEDEKIKKDIEYVKRELIDRPPEHFSRKDLLKAFMGSIFLGLSVLFSGNNITIAKNLPLQNLYLIIFFGIVVLTAEIYFIGYSKVVDKSRRGFGQFWIKRLLTFYIVGKIGRAHV